MHLGQQPQGQDGRQSRNQFLSTAPSAKPAGWKDEADWVKYERLMISKHSYGTPILVWAHHFADSTIANKSRL